MLGTVSRDCRKKLASRSFCRVSFPGQTVDLCVSTYASGKLCYGDSVLKTRSWYSGNPPLEPIHLRQEEGLRLRKVICSRTSLFFQDHDRGLFAVVYYVVAACVMYIIYLVPVAATWLYCQSSFAELSTKKVRKK